MSKLPTSRSELMSMGASCVAEVSSENDDKSIWTELSIWWIKNPDRPFFAVVERCVDADSTTEVPAFKVQPFGTWSRALSWFEPSNLRDSLAQLQPIDLIVAFPDANEIRKREASKNRGYSGDGSIEDVLDWLYEGALSGLTTHAIAKLVEEDFDVPWRTVTNALYGKATTGWYHGFIQSMRFFDRKAFAKARMER